MRKERIIIFFVSVIVISASIKLYLMTKKGYDYYGIRNVAAFKVQQSDTLYFANERLPLFNENVKINVEKALENLTYSKVSTKKLLRLMDKWFPVLDPIIEEYGIPSDFRYLVVVESGLKNVKSDRAALGFWQFRKDAAIENGLVVNEYLDQRLDPVASTHAACRYLNKIHKSLESWPNVAAAYNMGLTAFKRKQKAQGLNSYFDLDLNKETNYYIYKMIALKLLDEDRQSFGFRERYARAIQLPSRYNIDSTINNLDLLTQYKSVDRKDFDDVNPWMLTDSIPFPGQVYQISIP